MTNQYVCWTRKAFVLSFVGFCSAGISACSSSSDTLATEPTTCAALTGSTWVPQVSGVSASNHDAGVTLSQSTIETSGPVTGLSQPAPASREVSVTIDMSEDLGDSGSLTLMAQVTNYPSTLHGSAFAYLVSLHDGTNEYINLTRAGSGNDCAQKGYYTCTTSVCDVNPSCTVSWPSAYQNRNHWEQHQGYSNSAVDYPSVNTFPTCNWSGGSGQSSSSPSCAFNSTFFPAATTKLRYGVNYTAKYVLLSDSYPTLGGITAGLKVTVVKKKNAATNPGGALDINFILVGTKNIQSSRTAKGQQNLNTLAASVASHFSQSQPNIKIGAVNAVEWPCETGGDQYANVNISSLADLFKSSSSLIAADQATKAMNVFLVSSIKDDSSGADSNLTILGVDGAIGGPVMNGTAVSGMAVSTFDMLDEYNPNCTTSDATCPVNKQEEAFFQLGDTVTHEAGHFLGLPHLSEYSGTVHDAVLDTPICTATQSFGGSSYITHRSCLVSDNNVYSGTNSTCSTNCASYGISYDSNSGLFCPLAQACEFNYVMWWTTKNFYEATGASDGLLFSAQQSKIIHYHPIVQ